MAIAGPNGAGKTTFFHSHLAMTGLHFINADVIAAEMGADPYRAARLAGAIRDGLLSRKESFVFETVFSNPIGDKISFLERAADQGYSVVVCFIGLEGAEQSQSRVAMRVAQGGHDVPDEKIVSRFPRVLENLKRAIVKLPVVLLFDNSDLRVPFRLIAAYRNGKQEIANPPFSSWFPQPFHP